MDWTEQQKEAITRRDSGLIVSAAAGSGKTTGAQMVEEK